MRGALFLLLFLSMLPAAISAAHAGLMFYVWSSLITPNAFLYGPLVQLPYAKVAIVVAILAILADKTRRTAYIDLYYIFAAAFFLQCAISFSASLTETDAFYGYADRLWKIALLVLLMNPVLRGRLQIHSIVLIVAITMGVQGAMEGMKYLITAGGHKMAPPPNFGDNNGFGLFILMSLPLLMYLFRYMANPFIRLAAIGTVLINVLTIIGTGSRGAFVGMVAVTAVLILQSKRRLMALGAVAVIGIAVAWFVPSSVYHRVDTIQDVGEDSSFMGRVISWKFNTLVALDRPLVGGGFSAMEDPKVWGSYVTQFSKLSFIPSDLPEKPRAAHSIYFETLGDTGFPGLFFYLGMLATTFLSLRRIRKLTVADPSLGWAYDLAGYLRLTLIALAISGAALSVTYFDLPFIVFTLASALRRTVLDELQVAAPAAMLVGPRREGPLNRPKLARLV